MDIDKIISIIRNLKEEDGMAVGADGYTGAADPKGPAAGYDLPMKFDGRSKMSRRLPPPYKSDLINTKRKRKKKRHAKGGKGSRKWWL
ncbi:MAG: hypothetical protein EBS34_07380 [Flavobacteriales bacterium]|nr:hypothetical protein [Flavobacteriales bacterium]